MPSAPCRPAPTGRGSGMSTADPPAGVGRDHRDVRTDACELGGGGGGGGDGGGRVLLERTNWSLQPWDSPLDAREPPALRPNPPRARFARPPLSSIASVSCTVSVLSS